MSQLDQLPPDQRAALSLILRQGRSYQDVARLLRIEPQAVRERALAALQALGPRDVGALPVERRDEIADYLLGQQPASRRAETREYLEESPGGRAWGRVVASELRALAAEALPEIPAEGFQRDPEADAEVYERVAPPSPPPPSRARRTEAPADEPRSAFGRVPAVDRPARAGGGTRGRRGARRAGRAGGSAVPGLGRAGAGAPAAAAERSRVGQAVLLLGLGVIVAALIILITEGVIFGGSSSSDTATLGSSNPAASSTTTTSSSTTTSTPRIVAQIQFTPTRHAPRAAAIANVAQQGHQKAFALVAQGLAPTKGFAYAVWLYNPGGTAQPLGFINQAVGADGRAAAEGVLPANAPRFKQMVITQETASKPTHPGTIVLVGRLNA